MFFFRTFSSLRWTPMDWLFDFSCHGGPGAIQPPYGDDQETGRRGSCIYFCHNMCLVALKVVATMRLVSLKGFPNLHKLAAFKNHLNAMASQNRFRWSHLVQIGTWSAVTKSKFTHKKESRAAFETVLQQANWQRRKTPTRGIEPLVIWHGLQAHEDDLYLPSTGLQRMDEL